MNFLKISCMCSKFVLKNVNSSRFCTFINFPNKYVQRRTGENEAKAQILDMFSQNNVDSNQLEETIKFVRHDVGRYSCKVVKNLTDLILSKMNAEGVVVTTDNYNSIMDNYLTNGIIFNPTSFIVALKKKNLSFNNITLEFLLRGYCLLGDVDSSLKVLSKMNELKLFINGAKYSWLIGCYIRANDPEKVEEYFQIIDSKKMRLANSSVCFIIRSYASKCDVDNCLQLFDAVDYEGDTKDKVVCLYETLVDLIKSGTDKTEILKFIKYINKHENFKDLLNGIARLNKHELYDDAMFLLEQSGLLITDEDWKILILRCYSACVPSRYMKVLLKNIEDNIYIMSYVLRYIKPFDDAISYAEKSVSYNDIFSTQTIFTNLLINASSEANIVRALRKVFLLMESRINPNIYYTVIITKALDIMFQYAKESSYTNIIDLYGPDDTIIKKKFIFSCILHSLIMNKPSTSADLYNQYFENSNPLSTLLYEHVGRYVCDINDNIEVVIEIILESARYLGPKSNLSFIKSILKEALTFKSTDDFEKLLEFVCTNTVMKDNLEDLIYFQRNRSCSKEFRELIGKYLPQSSEIVV